MTASLHDLKPTTRTRLTRPEDGAESVHRWSQPEIDSLTLAQAAQRPLLVRGEPGTGKTQLARAVAQHLGWVLRTEVIHPRYEPQDLIYRFDAIRRLADAHQKEGSLKEANYWEPGALWRAFGWNSACQYGSCRNQPAPAGHVILIDEIDKADSDLPNSLLEVLGQRSFRIPTLDIQVGPVTQEQAKPLIIITTNEERELPPAFLRRCVVLNLEPDPNQTYVDWLIERGLTHFPAKPKRSEKSMDGSVIRAAAEQLWADRQSAESAGLQPPGPAEFLDLLYALDALAQGQTERQTTLLAKLSRYAFVKHFPGPQTPVHLKQTRDPLSGPAPSAPAKTRRKPSTRQPQLT